MALLTIEVIIELFSSLPLFLSSYILFKEYKKFRDRVMFHLSISWASFGLTFVFDAISLMLLSKFLFAVKVIFFISLAMNVEIAVSLMLTERVNYIRFATIFFISVFTLYAAFLPDAITEFDWPNGQPTLGAVGLFRIFFTLTSFWIALIYGYYAIKIYQSSYGKYKQPAKYHLFAYLIFGPTAILIFILKLNWIIPGLQAIFIGAGALLITQVLSKNPQLLYLLPFNAYRLSVIHQGSGLTIYSHYWSKQEYEVTPELLATVFESISIFANEALKMGPIKEIKFDLGTLLISQIKDHQLYILLVANQSSYSLKRGLKFFSHLFEKSYQNDSGVKVAHNLNEYKFADEFIEQSFPYVPREE